MGSHKGNQGRKEEYPTKTLDEKDVCGFGPGVVTGCRQPPELLAWVGLYGERGASCCPSSSSVQAPRPLSPQAGFPGAQWEGCRGEVSAWGESQAMQLWSSTAQGPEARPRHRRSRGGAHREQARAKYRHGAARPPS